jgi:hypothetical protein
LGLVLSALLIKDQNSEENSKTYLTMLSLTIVGLQEIIPKLMALQRGWFRHAKKVFEIFASLGTKRIGTWPSLTSPWVTRCPNTRLCLISRLTFYFLGDIPFTRRKLGFVTNKFATSCDYLTFTTIVGYIYNYFLHLKLLATTL